MLSLSTNPLLSLVETTIKNNCKHEYYDINTPEMYHPITCDGSSIWGDTEDRVVWVSGVEVVYDNNEITKIAITHDSDKDVYSDFGFAEEISQLLGFNVTFTEYMDQYDGEANMFVTE